MCNGCNNSANANAGMVENKHYHASRKPSNRIPGTDTFKMIHCHGLVTCNVCNVIHNRDKNSSKNMLFIVESIISGNGRPARFSRSNKQIALPIVMEEQQELNGYTITELDMNIE